METWIYTILVVVGTCSACYVLYRGIDILKNSDTAHGITCIFMAICLFVGISYVAYDKIIEPHIQSKNQTTEVWTCTCGEENEGIFCGECGSKNPEASWVCACGNENKSKFCPECGAERVD